MKRYLAPVMAKLQQMRRAVQEQEQGVALDYLALAGMALMGLAALALDGSNLYAHRRQMQTAADAAALAGVRSMALNQGDSQVQHDLKSLARANGAGQRANDVQGATGVDSTSLSVTARTTVPSYFARLFNFNEFEVGATAKAEYEPVKRIGNLFPLAVNCDCVKLNQTVTFESQVLDSALEFCPVNLNIKPGQTFNLRDYVHYKDSTEPVDWSKVHFVYVGDGANSPTNPSDWHLSDFNQGLDVAVRASDAAVGTGNVGSGRYRIYVGREGEPRYDDYTTIRIQSSSNNITSAKCPAPKPSTNQCKFTWIDWDGTPTTDDELFQNFSDQSRSGPWQVGDWLPSGPPRVTNLQCVDNLDQYFDRPVTIPLFDEHVQDGTHNSSTTYPSYEICGFAQFTLQAYDFDTTPKWVSGTFTPGVVKSITSAPDAPDFGLRSIHLLNDDAGSNVQH